MTTPRWYMVNKDGMATLCTDKADAEKEAADAQSVWPHMGAHRAVQLVEVASLAASAGSEPVAPSGWREAIGEIRAGLEDSEPSGYDNSGYRAFAGTVLDAVDDALAQLVTHHSPPEGMGGEWMPIETAPKHESVLLYSGGVVPIYCGRKRYGLFVGEPQQDTLAWRCDSSGMFANPTHWMPLPLPPTTAAGSGKGES